MLTAVEHMEIGRQLGMESRCDGMSVEAWFAWVLTTVALITMVEESVS